MGWCIGSLAQDPSVVGQHVSQTVRVRSFTSGHVHNSPAVMESVPGVVFNMGVLLSSLQLLGDPQQLEAHLEAHLKALSQAH